MVKLQGNCGVAYTVIPDCRPQFVFFFLNAILIIIIVTLSPVRTIWALI